MRSSAYHHDSKHFQLEKLAEGVYAAVHYEGGWAISNAGIIDLGDLALIFDTFLTPRAAEALRNSAEALTGKPVKIVINSHYHNDHIWGNQVFRPQAEIIASEQTSLLIGTQGKEDYRHLKTESLERLKKLQDAYEKMDELAKRDASLMITYYQGLVDSFPWMKVYLPTLTFEEKMEIHGSRRFVELYAFKNAHSPSDVIMIIPDEKIIFMGDLLFVGHHPCLDEADPQKLLSVYDEILQKFKPEILVPGYGTPGSTLEITDSREYIRSCYDIAGQFLQKQIPFDQIGEIKIPDKYSDYYFRDYFKNNIKKCYESLLQEIGKE